MNNTLWLFKFGRYIENEMIEIDIIQENTIKYKLEPICPFDYYNYIHKHNLNIVHSYKSTVKGKHSFKYIVSFSKEEIYKVYNEYIKINKSKENKKMKTLEMAIMLRKNPELKAQCLKEDKLYKVKCVDGNIIWDNNHFEPLTINHYILDFNWEIYKEEKLEMNIIKAMHIELNNGIGNLPHDKEIIDDIWVFTSDGKIHTIRPINKQFAVPTNDTKVIVTFIYNLI